MHPHLSWGSEGGGGAVVTDLLERLAELRVTVVLVSFLGTLPHLIKTCPLSPTVLAFPLAASLTSAFRSYF